MRLKPTVVGFSPGGRTGARSRELCHVGGTPSSISWASLVLTGRTKQLLFSR